ncbi:KilA-N domain-containing protein [Achromobacter anxifer]
MKFPSLDIDGFIVTNDSWNRFCLKEAHKASGASAEAIPKVWLALPETVNLIKSWDRICCQACLVNRSVPDKPISWIRGSGAFVIRPLVQDYSMWVSPFFHSKVVRAFRSIDSQLKKLDAERSASKELEQGARPSAPPRQHVATISLNKFASSIGMESRDLHQMLRADGVLITDGPDRNMPTKDQVSLGHLIEYEPDPVSCRPYRYVGVTHKGAQWLRGRYASE